MARDPFSRRVKDEARPCDCHDPPRRHVRKVKTCAGALGHGPSRLLVVDSHVIRKLVSTQPIDAREESTKRSNGALTFRVGVNGDS